jgi:hypothetical protein
MESLPLKEILASIVKEFEAAGVAADVSREHWRQVYESNALLKEFSPSRLKITEVSISLPLAFAQIGSPKTTSTALTHMQLIRLLPTSLPMAMREELAQATVGYISKTKRLTFANKNFTQAVTSHLAGQIRERNIAGLDEKAMLSDLQKNLDRLRDEFLNRTNLKSEREASFSYQTEELTKLPADQITRFEIKLSID